MQASLFLQWSSIPRNSLASCKISTGMPLRGICLTLTRTTLSYASRGMEKLSMLCSQFLKLRIPDSHSSQPYEFERRQLYLAAEGDAPKLGYIAKSPVADPNDVMPFFHKWGINLPWSKTAWVPRNGQFVTDRS